MTKLGFERKSVPVQMFKQKFRTVGLIKEKFYLHIWIQESKCHQKRKLGVFRIKLYVLPWNTLTGHPEIQMNLLY